MLSHYKVFKVTYNPHNFLYITSHKKGLLAWEVINNNTLESKIVPVSTIKDGETFLKSIGVWEQYENDYKKNVGTEINIESEVFATRTRAIIQPRENMTKIKVEEVIPETVLTKINEQVQVEIKRGRGRPKGSKNK